MATMGPGNVHEGGEEAVRLGLQTFPGVPTELELAASEAILLASDCLFPCAEVPCTQHHWSCLLVFIAERALKGPHEPPGLR